MLKRTTIIALSSIALVSVLALVALPQILGSEAIKTRIETAASQALNRETRIQGPLDISWLQGLRLTAQDVHIRDPEHDLMAANRADIHIAFLPLLAGKVRILSVHLDQPTIAIVRRIFAVPPVIKEPIEVLEIPRVSVTGATFSYTNPLAKASLSATDCDMQMQQLRLIKGPFAQALQNISFTAELSCGEFYQGTYGGSDLAATATAIDGILSLAPVTMQFLGGRGIGNVEADFTGPYRQYQVHYVLPQLNLEGLLNTLPPAFGAEGALDLTLNLALQGNNTAALTQSADGTIFLHGRDLKLTGIDLDEKFEQFESSQNFSLVDAGAFFFAGPLGLLATKGYDFTSLLQNTAGDSEIPSLISDWIITDGVAQASDVAMATRHNRIAVQGQLDLANKEFVDVTIALIDREGCSLVHQDIDGSFAKPDAHPPHALTTLAGPILTILERGASFFTNEPCEVFYSGTVGTAP